MLNSYKQLAFFDLPYKYIQIFRQTNITNFVFEIAEYIRKLDNQEFSRILCSIYMMVALFLGIPIGIFRNDFSLFFFCFVFALSMNYINVNNPGSKKQQNGKDDDDNKHKKRVVNQEQRPVPFPNTIGVVTQARSVNQSEPQELTEIIIGMNMKAEFQENAANLKNDAEVFKSSAIKKTRADHRALESK